MAEAEAKHRPVLGQTDSGITGDLFEEEKKDKDKDDGGERDEFGNLLPKTNPGRFEAVGKESKEILALDMSDGARISLQSPVYQSQEKMLAVQQMLWLGTSFVGESKGFYEFTTMLQTNKLVMTGAVDSLWRLQGRAISMMGKHSMGRLQFQLCPEAKIPDQVSLKFDYSGNDFSFSVDSTNILEQLSFGYLQKITDRLSVGTQYTMVPMMLLAPLTLVARYKDKDSVLTGNLCNVQDRFNLNLSYMRRVDKHYSVATELMMGFQKTSTAVGLKYNFLNDTKSRYSALFDTDFNCSATYSEEVIPGIRMGFCGQVANLKDDYMFGMTLQNGEP